MKKQTILDLVLLALITTFSGCSLIGGIFKTGMGVGIFISALVLVLIIYIISRIFKNKK